MLNKNVGISGYENGMYGGYSGMYGGGLGVSITSIVGSSS